ncbi:hypothetical protein M5X66_12165 [Providencia sp. PROV188]|uniref:hypothetical protein n=1 Tax=Providencia sp. PROV188 TaxID=2939731 RepID=UPI0022DCE4EE|nr:hypothetical protein M5X66_12165 [Providencia sp. PROV188]
MKRMFTFKLINIIEFNKKLVIRKYRVNKQKNHNINNSKTFDLMAVTKLKKEKMGKQINKIIWSNRIENRQKNIRKGQ